MKAALECHNSRVAVPALVAEVDQILLVKCQAVTEGAVQVAGIPIVTTAAMSPIWILHTHKMCFAIMLIRVVLEYFVVVLFALVFWLGKLAQGNNSGCAGHASTCRHSAFLATVCHWTSVTLAALANNVPQISPTRNKNYTLTPRGCNPRIDALLFLDYTGAASLLFRFRLWVGCL